MCSARNVIRLAWSASLALMFAVTITGAKAASVTLDFQSLQHIDANHISIGNTYTEDGFVFSTSGNGFFTTGMANTRYSGSTALVSNTSNASTYLSMVSGDTFSIASIDLSEWNSNSVGVTFTGTYSNAATTTQSFTTDGGNYAAETFYFNSLFSNLVQLAWGQVSPFHQFDNLVMNVSAVPLPPSAIIFGTALLGIAGLRRRKRKT